jgi:HSP20 family protein
MELVFENGWSGSGWLFDRLSRFRREVDEAGGGDTAPRADVVEDKDAYHFYFEMPGLKGDSFDVQVEDDRLMVAAERKRPELPRETEVHIAERSYGPIRRAFKLPPNASRDGIRAAYTDGVLELTIEKRAESKPVKVQVN